MPRSFALRHSSRVIRDVMFNRMKKNKLIKCNNIEYRKGYIEVSANIHPGFINLETWDIDADADITNIDLKDECLSDDAVVANTEIEMSVSEAENLIELLQQAVTKVKLNNK